MRTVYHPTRAEQETVIRWDREDPVVHLWSASPVVWRRMERLGVAVVRESSWPGGAVAGRWYTIPLAHFRWGLRRPGTRPGGNVVNFARARAARSSRSPQALGVDASFSPSVAGPRGTEASLPELAENSKGSARHRGPGRPFAKGQSGNPGGRPPEVGHIRELARQHTDEALKTLVEIMQRGKPDRARAAAAEVLLDRAWGRPAQHVDLGSDTTPLAIELRWPDGRSAGHQARADAE